MRELTQEEIDQAPDWADGYTIDDHGDIEWYMGDCFLVEHDDFFFKAEPIPRKVFDISQYLESDNAHEAQQPYIANEGSGDLNINGEITKFHAIGIAKHFKLI
jgi:hypothetical protein